MQRCDHRRDPNAPGVTDLTSLFEFLSCSAVASGDCSMVMRIVLGRTYIVRFAVLSQENIIRVRALEVCRD